MKSKYFNVTAKVLSSEKSKSGNGIESVKLHFDEADSPEGVTLKLNSNTFVSRNFAENDRIRIFSTPDAPYPVLIVDESFPDIFDGNSDLLNYFCVCDRSLQESIVQRNSGEIFASKTAKRVRLNSCNAAKAYYALTKKSFTDNQREVIEKLLEKYGKDENSQKLEYILGISTVYSNEEKAASAENLREALDARFYGMEKQKEEIVRHFTAAEFAERKGTVICLVGPAGTGKTALVRAIGEILNKPYGFIPCSGLTSALDIIGDRQVYNSASVGRLVELFHSLTSTDCICHLDEFDKMPGITNINKDGNPYNAFLQIFSERQITDSYLGCDIACPNTVFICTCNSLDNIPAFVQNRFESVINISAYTDDELIHIMSEYIIPKMNRKYRVPAERVKFTNAAVREVIRFIDDFGARRCEQHIETIYKQIASGWAESGTVSDFLVTDDTVKNVLGAVVDINSARVRFRRHIDDYSPAIVNKVISLEEQLDRPNERLSNQQYLQKKLEYFVNLRPDNTPFTFDTEAFYENADKQLYGMQKEKHLLASLFYELSVKSTSANKRILLVGAPGVGKTAIIQAAAAASGLNYVRIGLNGVQSPSYIKGYDGSYQNADAGIIVREVSKAGTLRAIIHLDELDKVANAETQSALISLLDDSGLFADNFLDGIQIDFRSAIFIATANDYNLSPALLSRFTVIEVGTYSRSQQQEILGEYLIPRTCEGYSVKIEVSDEAKRAFMNYSECGGVRELSEKVTRVIRETVFSKRGDAEISISAEDVYSVLGPFPLARGNRPAEDALPGLSNGLAVTGSGSGICFAIESRLLPGSGVEITGLPSEVIKDSVKLAMSVLSADYGFDFSDKRLHIHFAEGAVKKDGPSAGVSILMSIYSAASGKAISINAAYTGEVDLFGYVWAVGGIVEKIEAADAVGIRKAYIPYQNFEKLSDSERGRLDLLEIDVVPVKHIREIIRDVYGNEGI